MSLSWRRLGVLLRQLPTDSAFARSVAGLDAEWTLSRQLLAHVCDLLAMANWQRGGDKTAKRPSPIERPGVVEKSQAKRMSQGGRPLAEMREMARKWAGR